MTKAFVLDTSLQRTHEWLHKTADDLGFANDGWHPSAERLRAAHEQDFCQAISRELRGHDELQDAERVARVVLNLIDQRIDRGQVEHVIGALPQEVRCLWRDVQQETV